jgi:DNA polymerase-1
VAVAEPAAAAGVPTAPMPEATAAAVAANTTRDYETVLTEAQLEHWMQKISASSLTAVDTETTSLEPLRARIVGISLAVEPGHAAYIPLDHRYAGAPQQLGVDAVLAKLKPWLENAQAAKLGQNLKYDTHIFANHGVQLAGIQHDTLLQSYVLESHRSHDMDSLAERHLGVKTITFEEVAGKGAKQICFDQVSIETAQSNLDTTALEGLRGKKVILGVIDLSDPQVETAEVVAARIRKALKYIKPEQVILAPDCGMKYLPREVADGKLKAMVEAAQLLRDEYASH